MVAIAQIDTFIVDVPTIRPHVLAMATMHHQSIVIRRSLSHGDFAYATRDELIPPVVRQDDPVRIHAAGLNAPYAEIAFDFTLTPSDDRDEEILSTRQRVLVD